MAQKQLKPKSHIDKEMVPASKKVIPANASKSIYSVIKENMMSFDMKLNLKIC